MKVGAAPSFPGLVGVQPRAVLLHLPPDHQQHLRHLLGQLLAQERAATRPGGPERKREGPRVNPGVQAESRLLHNKQGGRGKAAGPALRLRLRRAQRKRAITVALLLLRYTPGFSVWSPGCSTGREPAAPQASAAVAAGATPSPERLWTAR